MSIKYIFTDNSKGAEKVFYNEIDNEYTFEYPCTSNYDCAPYEINFSQGRYLLDVWGAQGGWYKKADENLGGYSKGILLLQNETKGFLYVGGKGTATNVKGKLNGGFNGGGYGYYISDIGHGAGGGGASDIRLETDSYYTRIIVAGGGGGSGQYSSYNEGGSGGGEKGDNGTFYSGNSGHAAYGGTQVNPGEMGSKDKDRVAAGFGFGGSYVINTGASSGSGGGGGWYGGAASGILGFGGGGGSGYVLTLNSFKPNDYIYKREHFLNRASMMNGVQYGNGVIKITILNYIGKDIIKFRGCGTPGFSYSQFASLIALHSFGF